MSLLRKKSRPAPDHTILLAAIPLRNELVRVAAHANGLRLTAPVKPSPLRKFFVSPTAPQPEKSFDLDDLGAWVWNHIDGKSNIESLIRSFAKDHRINLRESEVAITAFLKTLTQRGLIALLAPKK